MARSATLAPTPALPPGMHYLDVRKCFAPAPEDIPDIITFNCDPEFLNRPNIYPRQGTLLKVMFLQEHLFTDYDHQVLDEWEAAYLHTADEKGEGNNGIVPGVRDRMKILSTCPCGHHVSEHKNRHGLCLGGLCFCQEYKGRRWFREVIAVMGRRGSKGHLGAIASAYILWNYICKGDPQDYYGVDRDKRLTCLVFAGKKEQAVVNQWRDLNNYILGAPCFAPYISRPQTEKLTLYSRHDFIKMSQLADRGIYTDQDQATFEMVPKESTTLAGRGPASFVQVYDEAGHVVKGVAKAPAEDVYCLDPGTRVLTADLVWKRIDDLVEGEALVSVDESTEGHRPGEPRKLRRAVVEGKWDTFGKGYRMTFDDGSSVICSGNHRWLKITGNDGRWQAIEKPTKVGSAGNPGRLEVGDRIKRFTDPWTLDDSFDGGYLSGIMDGEGHVMFQERGSCLVGISQKPGPVLDRIKDCLDTMGMSYSESRAAKSGVHVLTIRSTPRVMELLGRTMPRRLISNLGDQWSGRAANGTGTKQIVSIEELPERRLVDIQTSTGTFIAEGLVSHNSSASPSLDQFGVDSFTYIPSSPWQRIGLLHDKYQQAIERDEDGTASYPELLMVQLTSWDIYKDWEIAHTIDRAPAQEGKEAEKYQRLKNAVQVYDSSMEQLERANPETFRVERRCLDPNTRVLCADLQWRPIEILQPGDEVIGLDEHAVDGKARRMRTATVVATERSRDKAYRLVFEDGTSVVCSGNHRWFSSSGTRGGKDGDLAFRWRSLYAQPGTPGPRQSLKVGDAIRFLMEPWTPDDSWGAGYLAGVYDGEGTVWSKERSGSWISFPQHRVKNGDVLDLTLDLLRERGFAPVEGFKRGDNETWRFNGFDQVARFVGTVGGAKMKRQAIPHLWEGRGLPKMNGVAGVKRIAQIEELPEQDLIDIETTTGTFIAEGLVSHNSHFASVLNAYLNPDRIKAIWEPFDGEVLTQREQGVLSTTYRSHGDPSKSGAGFGFATAHVAKVDERGLPHVVFDQIKGWNPADFEGHEIDYDLIQREIARDTLDPFMPGELTFDQFNCLDSQTLVTTDRGLLTMQEIIGDAEVGRAKDVEGTLVQTSEGPSPVGQGFRRGSAETLRFTTKHGVEIVCTPEHRIWVRRAKVKAWHPDSEWKWLTAAEVRPGDQFRLHLGSTTGATARVDLTGMTPGLTQRGVYRHGTGWTAHGRKDGRQVYLGYFSDRERAQEAADRHYLDQPTRHSLRTYPKTLDGPLARYLGLLVSEGNVEATSTRVGNKDRDVLRQIQGDLTETFGEQSFSATYSDSYAGRYSYGSVSVGPRITSLLKALGTEDVCSQRKVVPWAIRRSPHDVQAQFLAGLFEGDGGITTDPRAGEWVHLTTTSERLGVEVQQMLHAMGILTTRWSGTYRYRGEERRQWRVKVFGPDLLEFRRLVGFLSPAKQGRLDVACDLVAARADVGLRDRRRRGADYYYDRVVGIEDGGERDCYDISVPGPDSFVANGVVCHNSVATIQALQRHARQMRYPKRVSIYERPATGPLNWKTYETFKTALGLGLIHGPYHELANLELTFLQDLGGKVEHPTSGPVQTKDIADCYHHSMEVLTEHGWMLFKDVPRGIKVATRSPEGRLEYQEPTDYIARHYTGPMYEYDSHRLNFSVTPKHRMLVLDANDRQQFIHAEDLTAQQYRIPKTALVEERTPNTIAFDIEDLSAARRRMQGRGGSRKDSGWTEDQDQYLREHYATTSMVDLCAVLGKTRGAIYNRAKPKNLDLKRGQIGDRIGDRPAPLPETKVEDFAAFLGIWLAEGRKMRDKAGYDVKITQTKPEAVEWIDQMFARLPWPVRRTVQANGETVWTVKSHGLREYLRACQGEGHELLIPDEVFATWTQREMERLLEGLLVGDGCWEEKVSRHTGYYSTSKRLVDDVQRLLLHLGLTSGKAKVIQRASQYEANHDLWYVGVNISKASTLFTDRLKKVDYDGMVYCLTVPNSTLLVRRNGVPMWSGNCLAIVVYELIGEQMSAFLGKMLSDVPLAGAAQGGFDPYGPAREEAHESLSSFGRGRQYGAGGAARGGRRRR